ncbi:hypothetical protein [Terasakiella sp.]|uniref:hypothetical protein n=1 Tax=Terasakiella sp. TaxID=2034861 RepID=UPI003AA90FF3
MTKDDAKIHDEDLCLKPSDAQRKWLSRGLEQAGGKLPLFDEFGQEINSQTVQSCIRNGWAEPWFSNPLKPDWLVCKLTDVGREVLKGD